MRKIEIIPGQGELFDANKTVPAENLDADELPAKQMENEIYKIKIGENLYKVYENFGFIFVYLENKYRGRFIIENNKIKKLSTINDESNKNTDPLPKAILHEMYEAAGVFKKIKLTEVNN